MNVALGLAIQLDSWVDGLSHKDLQGWLPLKKLQGLKDVDNVRFWGILKCLEG